MKTKLILFVLLVIFSLPAEAQRPQRSLNRDNHSGYKAVALPMHHAGFQHLYALVSQQGTDSRKILAARPVLETNMLNSNQVSVLVSLLTFERNKLELAKTAWARVYDPGNYFKVLNTFTFNSSIRELCETMEAFPHSGNASHAGLNGDHRNFRKLHMHPADFAEAKTAIVHQHNDAIRLMIARQLAFNNIMTSYQVYELMNAFTFEMNRLDFAIAAYPNVIDPGNYFLTHRALNFNSSVRQLNFAISNGRF